MNITPHLIELRQRLIRIFLCLLGFFCLFFFKAQALFTLMMSPLLRQLPANSHLIATHITSPLLTPLQLAFHLSMLASMPVILYHAWQFVAPALYLKERRFFYALLLSSGVLFLIGLLFCYFVVLPMLFHLFSQWVPEGVNLMPDMSTSLTFITRLCMVFGLCFQLPLINLVLVKTHLVSLAQLKAFRPYALVMAFTLGMLLTPPDVLSQLLLALPLSLLYEVGLLLCARLVQTA